MGSDHTTPYGFPRYRSWSHTHERTDTTHRRLQLTRRIRLDWTRHVHHHPTLPDRFVNQFHVVRDAR